MRIDQKFATNLIEYAYIAISNSLSAVDSLKSCDGNNVGLNPRARSKLRKARAILSALPPEHPLVQFIRRLNKYDIRLRDFKGNRTLNLGGVLLDHMPRTYSKTWDAQVETFIIAVPRHEKVYAFRCASGELQQATEVAEAFYADIVLTNAVCFPVFSRLKATVGTNLRVRSDRIHNLSDLAFIRRNLSDALMVAHSNRFDDFVIDPHDEALATYFLTSCRVLEADIAPRMDAVVFVAEDISGRRCRLFMQNQLYDSKFGDIHPGRFVSQAGPFFEFLCIVRFGESEPIILDAKPIKEPDFMRLQALSSLVFRRKLPREAFGGKDLSDASVVTKGESIYYIPEHLASLDTILAYVSDRIEEADHNKWVYFSKRAQFHEYFSVHPELVEVYGDKRQIEETYMV